MRVFALLLPLLLAGPKDGEWAKGIPYTTDFELAIKQAKESGKILFIYNGWEGDKI